MRSNVRRIVPPPPPRSGGSNGSLSQHRPNNSRKGILTLPTRWIFVTMMLCALSFYGGLILGMNGCNSGDVPSSSKINDFTSSSNGNRFPSTVQGWAAGMSRVSKRDFVQTFDVGVPVDAYSRDNRDVLIIYNHKKALPLKQNTETATAGDIPQLGAKEATKNCHTLKIVLTGVGDKNQCMALMGNWEDYHIQKWMRLGNQGPINPKLPLRHVSKSHNAKNKAVKIPSPETQLAFFHTLQGYIGNLDMLVNALKPLAAKVALQNNIVVMVCNRGQSELLMNFVCNARAKNLDTSQVLLFAIDRETKDLAEGLGLTVFYDKTVFGDIRSEAARRYGDPMFTGMMMAKVYCVQLISMLGYNILFQDADVVWFKNPIDYFEQISSDFDIYFQDDGARTARYAPYSPNTGFYYIRHNERTQYFLSVLLRMSDMIATSGSHQSALNQVLAEHVSWRGLRVKVFHRQFSDFFPGGWTFHQRDGKWMKDFFAKKKDPFIFHMSWTENKKNKILFFKQMGEWYLQPTCVDKTAEEVMFESVEASSLEAACCAAEPLFSCHYRDKPSKFPCKDSPPIDNGRPSFW